MRKTLFFLALFSKLLAFAQITQSDFLKTNGRVLCNSKGDTIMLRGTNLGSWLSFENWMSPSGYGAIGRKNWTISAQYTKSGTNLTDIIDGDLTTMWNSGMSQNTINQWVMIDMSSEEIFSRIEFTTGINALEYPRSFDIYKSSDANQWTKLGSFTASNGNIKVDIGATTGRYIRIIQKSTAQQDWSISELNVCMNDDIHVRKSLINRFGEDGADELLDYYCKMWISEKDLDQIKSMGMNVVRVPFFWMEIMREDGTIKQNGFRHLDWVVEQCTKRGIYVIPDLHCSPGGNDGYITSGMAISNNLWTNTNDQQLTKTLWKAVAEHFKDNPTIACYDVLNESFSNSSDMTVDRFYDILYTTIRNADPDHILCFQAFYSFDYITSPANHGWENVMYQAHYYNTDYHNYTSQDNFAETAISDMVSHQQKWNVPILAGEFSFWEHTEVWKKFFRGLNSSLISWTNWSYKCRESIASRDNFAFYTDNYNNDPNLIYDEIPKIKAQWDKFATDSFKKNVTLAELVKTSIVSKPVVPTEKQVYIQQFDEQYLCLLPNEQLSFSTYDQQLATSFTIKSVDKNQVVILAQNNKYLSADGGSAYMTCSKNSYNSWERFIWIDLGKNQFGLFGNSGFASGEGGSGAILTCNRNIMSGWERFTWIEKKTITSTASLPESSGLYVFNKTLRNTDSTSKKVCVYTCTGQLISILNLNAYSNTELALPNGYYLLSSTHDNVINQKKILLQ